MQREGKNILKTILGVWPREITLCVIVVYSRIQGNRASEDVGFYLSVDLVGVKFGEKFCNF